MKSGRRKTDEFLSQLSPVSVVIPTSNRYAMLKRLLESLEFTEFAVKEIIIIDDSPDNPVCERIIAEFPYVICIKHNYVMNVGESRNEGIRLSSGDYIFMVDDDNVVDPKCIGNLVNKMREDSSIGVVVPVSCYYSDQNRVMYAGVKYSKYIRRTIFLYKGEPYSKVENQVFEIDSAPNCYMFRKDAVVRVYPIPKELPWCCEEAYLQYRIKNELGLKLVLVGNARVYHDSRMTQFPSEISTFKLYYVVRGKITFEKIVDRSNRKFLFYLGMPLYIAYYLQWALRTKEKREAVIAVIHGIKDGLLGIYVDRYSFS